MISVIGLGNAATAIVEKFKDISQYNVYVMNSKVARNSKYKFKLKKHERPEAYEEHMPNVKKFFSAYLSFFQSKKACNYH